MLKFAKLLLVSGLLCASIAHGLPLCQQKMSDMTALKKQTPSDCLLDSEFQLRAQQCRHEVIGAFDYLYLLSSSHCVHLCSIDYTQCNNASYYGGDPAAIETCFNAFLDCMPACYLDV